MDKNRAIKTLNRSLKLSQGKFCLIFVRCNYVSLQNKILKRLHQESSLNIQALCLSKRDTKLYSKICDQVQVNSPEALIVLGFDAVDELQTLLREANRDREKFKRDFSFPIVFWLTDKVIHDIGRFASDLSNWATSIQFKIYSEELQELLHQKIEQAFAGDRNLRLNQNELVSLQQDLQDLGENSTPDLEASLAFLIGFFELNLNQIETAFPQFQKSLEIWKNTGNLEREGIVYTYLATAYIRQAEQHPRENSQYWVEARHCLEKSLDYFEQIQRSDLIAKTLSQLGEVLRNLKDWSSLKNLAQKGLTFHQAEDYHRQFAQDYGFLAEVSLNESDWKAAKKNAQKALNILSNIPEKKSYELGEYRYLLAQSWSGLGQKQQAIRELEQAKSEIDPQFESQCRQDLSEEREIKSHQFVGVYIKIIETLQDLCYQQKDYLKAFNLKLEKRKIESQYRLRAFIGAGQLQSPQQTINLGLKSNQPISEIIAEILAASGREINIRRLIERMERTDHKITVIYGPSGVGKSSILKAGLLPVLNLISFEGRQYFPILIRVYTNWVKELGKRLNLTENSAKIKPQHLLEKLQQNHQDNLVTVLIFDQFEEFFFDNPEPSTRQVFYEFLQQCSEIPYLKIILSLREDYIYYVLEFSRKTKLTNIDKNYEYILFYLGNFSDSDAQQILQTLTQRSQSPFELDLIQKLVKDLTATSAEVRPIELQVVGSQLEQEKITTLKQYQTWGDAPISKLVQHFLESAVVDCGQQNKYKAQLVLYLLTNENNTRPLKTKRELAEELTTAETQLDLILEILEGSGLILRVPGTPEDYYQLVHDYLVRFIRQNYEPQSQELRRERQHRQRLQKQLLVGSMAASGIMAILAGVAIIFGVQANQRFYEAERQGSISLARAAQTLTLSGDHWEARMTAMEAAQKLKNTKKLKPVDEASQITDILRLTLYEADEFREVNRLTEYQDRVLAVAFSPDSETIASAGGDTIKLWNRQGKLLQTLKGHQQKVNAVAFSPDGMIASASHDQTIKLWNRQGQVLQTLTGHKQEVNAVAFSHDGMIASASHDQTIKLWNRQGQVLQTLTGHRNYVYGVAFSPDGMIASASRDRTIKLWNRQGQVLQTLTGHQDIVWGVAFSPDGKIIASASHDRTIKLWNRQGQLLQTLTGHQDIVWGVAFSPDGKIIASASHDRTIKLWNRQGQLLQTLTGHQNYVNAVAFSPDGMIASASGGTIKLWNRQRQLLQTLEGVRDIAFSPDGMIASASEDRTIKLWNRQGQLLQTLTGHQDRVTDIAFSPDDEMIASASEDRTIKLWNRQGQLLQTLTGHQDIVSDVTFSPDGEMIASASHDRTIKLWNRQGQLLQILPVYQGRVYGVAFSPDGKTIASASDDQTIKWWNRQGQLLQTLEGVRDIAFSPDGKTIVSAEDKTIKRWNRQGQLLQTLTGHQDRVTDVTFSPDGTIASASRDNTIKLWNRQGQLLQTLTGNQDWVFDVTFSPDNKIIASASHDRTIKLWPHLDFERLVEHHCEGLSDYLVNHPQELEKLKMCQTPVRREAAARSWVTQGEKAAREGNVREAINLFRKALKWNSKLQLNPKAVAVALAEARKSFKQGEELAEAGNIQDAVLQFQTAIEQDASLKDIVANTLLKTGRHLGRQGKIEQAIAAYTEAKQLNPNLKDIIANNLLKTGRNLAEQGEIEQAITAYTEVEQLDSNLTINAWQWNRLCRNGSLNKFAAKVMFACEKAVELDPKNGEILDSRGLARALTGDKKGAIEDFQAFVEWTEDETLKAQRQGWIKILRAGENPFTDEVLQELR